MRSYPVPVKKANRINRKWQKLKPKADRCPNCGCRIVGLNDCFMYKWKRFFINCEECHWCGRRKPTIRMAIKAWNKDGAKMYLDMLRRVYGGK